MQNPQFHLWLEHIGYTYSTDIDTIIFNIKYHLSEPEPFLDLPWDYAGMSFDDSALAINSYFDHSFPLLSVGLREPSAYSSQLTTYENKNTNLSYSSHDGYDYGRLANVKFGDPVTAAAEGWATYVNSCASCGNMIVIDHRNGYQTRYLHLQNTELFINVPGQKAWVESGRQIGLVGATGNVSPPGVAGAHIHFGVFKDGLPTDPFGWQSTAADPWESYSFFSNGSLKKGAKSYYLWKERLGSLVKYIDVSGGTMNVGHFTAEFPEASVPVPVTVAMNSSPYVRTKISGKNYVSVGPALKATATDALGSLFEAFTSAFRLIVDIAYLDPGTVNTSTLSIYSSEDGSSWKKEDTTIDMTNKKATARINHFSYFALMVEVEGDVIEGDYSVSASGARLSASPSSDSVTVGTPFTVDIKVESDGDAFNAVRADVDVSSNLSITRLSAPSSNPCNLFYVQNPTTSNLSFAGAIFGGASSGCTVYTLTLTPTAAGRGTITLTNGSVKAYSDNSEILTGVQNASFTIDNTVNAGQLTVNSPTLTYLSAFHLFGTKDPLVSHVFANDSEAGVTYQNSTSWDASVSLALGNNNFTLYGRDNDGSQTSSIQTSVKRHIFGDINGDGLVNLTDASLFAIDWDKTENLIYILSDMNNDGIVDLVDLSILAKLE